MSNIGKVQIYFTSGTGNSLLVAKWMAKTIREKNIDCHVSSIDNVSTAQDIKPAENVLLGFINPTHGFAPPWHMLKFVLKIPRTHSSTKAFCAATRAGWFVGPWRLPGIAGMSAFLIAFILFCKGYKIRGTISLDMPTNWLQLHWGLKRKNIDRILQHTSPRVRVFITGLLEGRTYWRTWNNLWETAWVIALWWISLLYMFYGRFFLGKLFFADHKCNYCGLCFAFCPVGGIGGTGKRAPYWTFKCQACMRCMAYCPQGAVQAGWPWAAVMFYLMGIPLARYAAAGLAPYFPELSNLLLLWPGSLLEILCVFPIVFIAYHVFHFLARFSVLKKILHYTTPTAFWRRYHAPGVRLQELAGEESVDNPEKKQK
ncbi:MAG: hypothetical protein GY765_04390 [bacterium]|nr:hypothetical protein [bacterium]